MAQQVEVKRGVFAMMPTGFPNTNVAIDGTNMAIKASSQNKFNCVNRKGFHS
jgi:hypothetical protein